MDEVVPETKKDFEKTIQELLASGSKLPSNVQLEAIRKLEDDLASWKKLLVQPASLVKQENADDASKTIPTNGSTSKTGLADADVSNTLPEDQNPSENQVVGTAGPSQSEPPVAEGGLDEGVSDTPAVQPTGSSGRRKRGRPKKIPQDQPEKRPRGRPAKTSGPKRKRGRPSKRSYRLCTSDEEDQVDDDYKESNVRIKADPSPIRVSMRSGRSTRLRARKQGGATEPTAADSAVPRSPAGSEDDEDEDEDFAEVRAGIKREPDEEFHEGKKTTRRKRVGRPRTRPEKTVTLDEHGNPVRKKVGRPFKTDYTINIKDLLKPPKVKEHQCPRCDKAFMSPNSLRNHVSVVHESNGLACSVCNKKFFSKGGLSTHERVHSEDGLQCPHCAFRCGNSAWLDKHLQKHLEPSQRRRPFLCDVCGRDFVTSGRLKEHFFAIHLERKDYTCSQCDFCTHSVACLKSHVRNKHTDCQPHICDICGASIKFYGSFIEHKRRHFGEKPYGCEQCSARFVSKSQLAQHRKIHTERRCVCDVCNKKFTTKHHLRRHQTIHTKLKEHQCPFCNYCCNVRSNLRKHCLYVHKVDHDRRQSRVLRLDGGGGKSGVPTAAASASAPPATPGGVSPVEPFPTMVSASSGITSPTVAAANPAIAAAVRKPKGSTAGAQSAGAGGQVFHPQIVTAQVQGVKKASSQYPSPGQTSLEGHVEVEVQLVRPPAAALTSATSAATTTDPAVVAAAAASSHLQPASAVHAPPSRPPALTPISHSWAGATLVSLQNEAVSHTVLEVSQTVSTRHDSGAEVVPLQPVPLPLASHQNYVPHGAHAQLVSAADDSGRPWTHHVAHVSHAAEGHNATWRDAVVERHVETEVEDEEGNKYVYVIVPEQSEDQEIVTSDDRVLIGQGEMEAPEPYAQVEISGTSV